MKNILCFLVFLLSFEASASLVLSEVILDFYEGAATRRDVTVRNEGKERYYLTVDPYKITNPGEAVVKREAITNPAKASLIVSPRKLILEPGATKTIRFFLPKGLGNQEEVYRVRVEPKLGKIKLGKGEKEQSKKSALKVLVGYELLVMLRPKKHQFDLDVKREGKKLTIKNKGNSNVLVTEIKQCEGDASKQACANIAGPRVYAGKTEIIELPQNKTADIYLKSAGDLRVIKK